METLTQVLFIISNGLLVPVIVALLLLTATTTLQLGGFAAEALVRRRRRPLFARVLCDLKSNTKKTVSMDRVSANFGLPARAYRELLEEDSCTNKVLDDLQLHAERLLGRLNLGVRLGPILGLAGTLIPLGPALLALSTGDFNTLASNLVVAFTTTVLGLIVGGTCFAIHAVRKTWYMQDLNDIEFLARRKLTDA